MKTMIIVAGLVALASLSAMGEEAKPAGMDMSKVGPWSRKTDDAKVKKEVQAFLARNDEAEKKGDMQAQMSLVDFPVYMTSDAAGGKIEASEWSREQWEQMMKPFFENMPKDTKTTHKRTITVLSDSLANVTDEFTMNTAKHKLSGRNVALLVKRNGEWKWKSMTEAGWAGMGDQSHAQK